VSSSLEWAPESAGSEIFFVREVAQAYRYTPWRRLVFASAARLGMVAPLGGQEVIPSVRFFGGGSRTVRGVAEDGLGARDFLGDPAGGQGQLILNQEVRFPLYRWLRGVGFLDAGNVFAKPRDISFGNLVASVGAGLRLATPFAVLRVDYGRAVSGTGTDRSGRWTFGIGHTF
ncbi:MAG: BamA/TamA family outer membrane protein, partial [Vicinamibacterales bacterium]